MSGPRKEFQGEECLYEIGCIHRRCIGDGCFFYDKEKGDRREFQGDQCRNESRCIYTTCAPTCLFRNKEKDTINEPITGNANKALYDENLNKIQLYRTTLTGMSEVRADLVTETNHLFHKLPLDDAVQEELAGYMRRIEELDRAWLIVDAHISYIKDCNIELISQNKETP